MRNATLKRTERISLLLQNITYHVTCRFQSESTLCSLRECQGTPYSKQAPYLSWVFVYELSGCGFESCCCQCKIIITCFSMDKKVPKVEVLANAFSNTQFYYASMIWMFAEKRWYQKFKRYIIEHCISNTRNHTKTFSLSMIISQFTKIIYIF